MNLSNNSNLSKMDDMEVQAMFRGIFRDLAPVQIPLSILVLIQNSVIARQYYRERTKFVSSLFLGIALADILKAQGELVLSGIGLLAYAGYLEIGVLYNSLMYYMMTALPGLNCSKLFNIVLTISLTFNIVNPFRRINTELLRKVVVSLGVTITLLHFSDAIVASVLVSVDKKLKSNGTSSYLILMLGFEIPGSVLIAGAMCHRDHTGYSKCTEHPNIWHIIGGLLAFLYFLVLPLTVFICMMIQVKHLRRALRDETQGSRDETQGSRNEASGSCGSSETARHVSITVFLVSTLFFVCNATYCVLTTAWLISNQNIIYQTNSEKYYVDLGMQVGCILMFYLISFLLSFKL